MPFAMAVPDAGGSSNHCCVALVATGYGPNTPHMTGNANIDGPGREICLVRSSVVLPEPAHWPTDTSVPLRGARHGQRLSRVVILCPGSSVADLFDYCEWLHRAEL